MMFRSRPQALDERIFVGSSSGIEWESKAMQGLVSGGVSRLGANSSMRWRRHRDGDGQHGCSPASTHNPQPLAHRSRLCRQGGEWGKTVGEQPLHAGGVIDRRLRSAITTIGHHRGQPRHDRRQVSPSRCFHWRYASTSRRRWLTQAGKASRRSGPPGSSKFLHKGLQPEGRHGRRMQAPRRMMRRRPKA